MARIEPLDPAKLSPEQQRIYDDIGGARRTVRGPFQIWLHNPPLAEHANQIGLALRDHSDIERRLFELAVITVCRLWTVQYAWASHAPAAEIAGIAPDIIAAIRDKRPPDFKRDDERMVYDITLELMETKTLSEASHRAAIDQFGLKGTIDLVATVGYYAMVGITLKAFDVPPLSGEPQLK